MEILPSDYENKDIEPGEKALADSADKADKSYGLLLLKVNPAMTDNESIDALITSKGVVFFKFLEGFKDASLFNKIIPDRIRKDSEKGWKIISEKLLGIKSMSEEGKLKFPVNYVYVLPKLKRADVSQTNIEDISQTNAGDIPDYVWDQCLFAEDFSELRQNFEAVVNRFLETSLVPVADSPVTISDKNVCSVLQRIAPQYVTVRAAGKDEAETAPGINGELLAINNKDAVVRAFRLDEEQINIVNRMSKTEPYQLILACAGAGKSVLLIAKCFKAAQMNPNKKFLITCKSTNLRDLYVRLIDFAGLRGNNVECMTFHALCRTLLKNNELQADERSNNFEEWVESAINGLKQGKIKDRYYGVFIDEVQMFDPEWYKFCFDLLENKQTKDHIFVICGDKTQRLEKQKKSGGAPWQAGEGYPDYRGGYKNITIKKNYRNCAEINDYINRFISGAKQYLSDIQFRYKDDGEMFLSGEAKFPGGDVELIRTAEKKESREIDAIVQKIREAHEKHKIPYDEIAVIMYEGEYKKKQDPIEGWGRREYILEQPLTERLSSEGIRFSKLYSSDEGRDRIGGDGVKLIKFETALGLDFRAVIICGLIPLGCYYKTKNPKSTWLKKYSDAKKTKDGIVKKIKLLQCKSEYEKNEENKSYLDSLADATQVCIQNLYSACTRARERLYIITHESEDESVYTKLLSGAVSKERET